MSGNWKRVPNVAKFLAEKGQKRIGEHAFTKMVVNYPYCAHCGLVALKNDATRKAMKEKCIYYDD